MRESPPREYEAGPLIAGTFVLAVCSAVLWWLFGFSTIPAPTGTLRLQRSWGRVIRADADFDGDGRIDESMRYTWRNPMQHHQEPALIVSDRNADGRWDLWIAAVGNDGEGYPLARFSVDTNGDGIADWSFVARSQDQAVYERIKARRGF